MKKPFKTRRSICDTYLVYAIERNLANSHGGDTVIAILPKDKANHLCGKLNDAIDDAVQGQ